MRKIDELVTRWRDIGPVDWAEGDFGWIKNGHPITLTDWQRAVLDTWYAYRDDVSTLAVSNVKKTGKTFINAILTAWRWLCLPGEHFVCGNDLDQSAGRVFKEISEMCKKHPTLSKRVKIRANCLTFEATGSTLQPLPVDASGNAGSNHCTSSHTECWGVLYEGARRAYEELTPPPGEWHGFCAVRIVDSYAGWQGESELWHNLVDRGLAGDRVSGDWPIFLTNDGLMLFHMTGQEAQRRCFWGAPKARDRYYRQQKASLRKNAYSRLHENERTGSETSFLPTIALWDSLGDPDLYVSLDPVSDYDIQRNQAAKKWRPETAIDLFPSVIVSIDASTGGLVSGRSGDSTGLVVMKKIDPDKCAIVHVKEFRCGKDGLIDYADLERTFNAIRERFVVLAVVFDPYSLADFYNRHKSDVSMIPFGQQNDRTLADSFLYSAIVQGRISHYGTDQPGGAALRKHILACASKAAGGADNSAIRLVKKSPYSKIDLAVCASMGTWWTLNKLRL